jgi:thiamine-phosphate pyrophosphorylase
MDGSLDGALLYLVAPARLHAGALHELVPELVAAGVDIVQLREKEMEGFDLMRAGEPIREACGVAGVPFVINDRVDVAVALAADGIHLGTNDLPTQVARRQFPGAFVGRSSHSPSDLDEVVQHQDPDYFAAGPVTVTPTKPGRPAAGLDYIRHVARSEPSVPWYAIGGIDLSNLSEVLEAGARRVVVVRAITEADDPCSMAARLKEELLGAAS